MTHLSQPSYDDRRPASADAGSPLLQSLDLPQDDIVRPELRNDAILAGKQEGFIPLRTTLPMEGSSQSIGDLLADSSD